MVRVSGCWDGLPRTCCDAMMLIKERDGASVDGSSAYYDEEAGRVNGRWHGWAWWFCYSSHQSCFPPPTPHPPGDFHQRPRARDAFWERFWGLGGVFPRCIAIYSLTECGCITMTTEAGGESGDSLTPGGNRKHHLHFAHSSANHSRLTWFMQSTDMLCRWQLWSRHALAFLVLEIWERLQWFNTNRKHNLYWQMLLQSAVCNIRTVQCHQCHILLLD